MSKFVPKIKKQLVLPILKIVVETPIYITFVSPVKAKEKVEIEKDGTEKRGEINIAHVVNMETGEECHVVMGSVLLSTLLEEYTDNSYVGLSFMVTKQAQRGTGSKKYHPYLLAEIEGA